jgi:NDP-sugar pyrophosphorylase family protein
VTRQALILAGGAGTRLRPLVHDLPKALAVVAGRPFIEYLLMQLRGNGIRQAVVCAGYRADALQAYLGDGSAWGMELVFSVESSPLGTGGAIRQALPRITGERCLVMNGDSFFDIPIADLDLAHERSGASLTVALAKSAGSTRYGSVVIDQLGKVIEFHEKSPVARSDFLNAGLYIIERDQVARFAADRPVSLEREILPALIGHGLHGIAFDGYFVDIGVPEDFFLAQQNIALWERVAAT